VWGFLSYILYGDFLSYILYGDLDFSHTFCYNIAGKQGELFEQFSLAGKAPIAEGRGLLEKEVLRVREWVRVQ
tara:strand:+ start:614 stop:832 length:219 start_codon:yes stop_codon:yes gene_type:complete